MTRLHVSGPYEPVRAIAALGNGTTQGNGSAASTIVEVPADGVLGLETAWGPVGLGVHGGRLVADVPAGVAVAARLAGVRARQERLAQGGVRLSWDLREPARIPLGRYGALTVRQA